jgi:exopolyphosphatase / guanosine-5'-triphosphate,3'-diphosphate pyrophosphatase
MTDSGRIGAAIEVGSNSVHLLVAELADDGLHVVLRDESLLLGLGAVVDMEGRIPDDEADAAIEVLQAYAAAGEEEGARWLVLLATEPLRRASNRSHFCERVREALGRPLHVLTYEEEAELTVLGVLNGEPPAEATLVLDIGGGSSEVILLEPGSDPVVGVMPVGSARLTAAHVEADPPTADEVQALRSEAHHLLSGMPAGHPRRGIVVGGSGTNLVRLTVDLADDDDSEASPDPADWLIDRRRTQRAIDIVMAQPSAELVESYGLRQRRILQMAAGASLIEAALDCYNLEQLEASDGSLREGALLAWDRAGEAWREQLSELISG